jgi:hypothetical protein
MSGAPPFRLGGGSDLASIVVAPAAPAAKAGLMRIPEATCLRVIM